MSDQPEKTYVHIVRERYCKGCNICVAFCPRHVLALKGAKVWVEHPELCIGCKLCELRCPDFAIEVHEKGEEGDGGTNGGDLDFSLPPEAMHD
jgi:2-oxoglutarate ferredoxin oxidoreductase subunit delta